MIAFILGIFIGFVMCIPVGPINVLVINTQIKKTAARALAIAFGGSLMDFVYFFAILSGLSLFNFNEKFISYFKSAGIFLIFIMGIRELLSNNYSVIPNVNEKHDPKGIFAGFILGVIIYTSNPTLIFTMTGIGAFVKSMNVFDLNQTNILLISSGLALGSFLWFFLLSKIVKRYQEIIRNKYLHYFNKVSGLMLISLSVFMSYKLYFS